MPSRQNSKPMHGAVSSGHHAFYFVFYCFLAIGYKLSYLYLFIACHYVLRRRQFPGPTDPSDHIKTRHPIMSDSKFFDDAKGCSDEIGDRSDAQNQELVNDQISDPNKSEDAANSSPSGTPAGGNVPFPSMNNQLQMSVEPESGVSNLQIANTFLAEENINLNFECGLLKRAQKRQKKILDGEKEKSIRLADMAANLSNILLMGPEAQLRERIAELEASNAQLRERNTELEASNAQLRERNTQLENGSNERVVDKENKK